MSSLGLTGCEKSASLKTSLGSRSIIAEMLFKAFVGSAVNCQWLRPFRGEVDLTSRVSWNHELVLE